MLGWLTLPWALLLRRSRLMGKTRCVTRVERALDHPGGQRNCEVSRGRKEVVREHLRLEGKEGFMVEVM